MTKLNIVKFYNTGLIFSLAFCLVVYCSVISKRLNCSMAVAGATTQASDKSIPNRIKQTIDSLRYVYTNNEAEEQANRQTITIVRAATEQSLSRPILVPSFYFPREGAEEYLIILSWIADEITLRNVTIVNPINGNSIDFQFDPQKLADSHANEMHSIIYRETIKIPKSFIDQNDLPTLVATTDNGRSWTIIYPSRLKK